MKENTVLYSSVTSEDQPVAKIFHSAKLVKPKHVSASFE